MRLVINLASFYKKSAILIILTIIIASNSVFANLKNCQEASIPFLFPEINYDFNAELLKIGFEKGQYEKLLIRVEKATFGPLEKEYILNSLKQIPEPKKEFGHILDYITLVKTLKSHQKNEALKQLAYIANPKFDKKYKYLKQFYYVEKKVTSFSKREFKKQIKKVGKSDINLSPAEIEKIGKSNAYNRINEYRRTVLGCSTKTWNPQHRTGAKLFKRLTIGIGFLSAGYGYSKAHWDEEKNSIWFRKLGYEFTTSFAFSVATAFVIPNPNWTPVQKAFLKYSINQGIGLVESRTYQYFWGIASDDAKKKLKQMMSTPEGLKDLRKLKAAFEGRTFVQEFKEEFIRNIKNFFKDEKDKLLDPSTIDLGKISLDDLDNPNTQHALIEAILAELYAESASGYVKTGDKGFDRYLFYSGYGIFMMPYGTFMSLLMYKTMCMNAMNPAMAFAKAIAIFTISKVLSDRFHYAFRNKFSGM